MFGPDKCGMEKKVRDEMTLSLVYSHCKKAQENKGNIFIRGFINIESSRLVLESKSLNMKVAI